MAGAYLSEHRWVQLRPRVLLATAPILGAALVAAMLWGSEIPVPAGGDSSAAPGLPAVAPREPGDDRRSTATALGARVSATPTSRTALEDPDLELPAPVTDPVSEKEFYRALRSQGVLSLERTARDTLAGAGPDCEKVALLRALHDLRSEEFSRHFAWAIRSLPDTSSAQGESVPSFAVHFLGKHAARDPLARKALEQVAFESRPAVAPGLRRRAAARFGATASAAELRVLSTRLATESDSLVVAGVLTALQINPNKVAATTVLTTFGRPPTIQHQAFTQAKQLREKERLP